jgi:hypothetical protein
MCGGIYSNFKLKNIKMKKLLLLSVLTVFIISSCRKKDHAVSTTVTASYPTITFTNGQFFSIHVGGLRPAIVATAFDSFYREIDNVLIVDSTINNLVPGLYVGKASSKNHYGFIGSAYYYVAVTNVSDSMDLSGRWLQVLFGDSTATDINKLAVGLYSTSNLEGVNMFTSTVGVTNGFFAVLNDTTIAFDPLTVAAGNVTFPTGTLTLTPIVGDTTITYGIPGSMISFFKH